MIYLHSSHKKCFLNMKTWCRGMHSYTSLHSTGVYDSGKKNLKFCHQHCIPWKAFCSIYSGSTLFAYKNFSIQNWTKMEKNGGKKKAPLWKKFIERSRVCHSHKQQSTLDTQRNRKGQKHICAKQTNKWTFPISTDRLKLTQIPLGLS